jgi:hypothetical protein
MPGMISLTTLLKLLTSNFKVLLFMTGISLSSWGCQGVPTPASMPVLGPISGPVTVSVDWETIVRAHPLQRTQQVSLLPATLFVGTPTTLFVGTPTTLFVGTPTTIALKSPTSFALPPKTRPLIFKQEKTTKIADKIRVASGVPLSFRTQKQRLWEAEIGSNRLVALREAETVGVAQTTYIQDGLLEWLQEQRRVLLEAQEATPNANQSQKIATLTAQITTIEQVQMQVPGIDLAIAVLEKQRESLPSVATLGVSFTDEVARLTKDITPETVREKENLRSVVQGIIKQPGSYSEQARLEACVRVYKTYREGLTAQLEVIRQDVEREQTQMLARRKAESNQKATERWQALQQMAPPGLTKKENPVLFINSASLQPEPLAKMGQMARFDAEKKRILSTSPVITMVPHPSRLANLGNQSDVLIKSTNESKKQLQIFIEQDCVIRLQEVAKERGMIVHLRKSSIGITKNKEKSVSDNVSHNASDRVSDKTSDFVRWMWAYQSSGAYQANTGARE